MHLTGQVTRLNRFSNGRPAIDGADVVVYRDAAKHSMVAQKSLNGKGERNKSSFVAGTSLNSKKQAGLR
jgi:hypothetical protein